MHPNLMGELALLVLKQMMREQGDKMKQRILFASSHQERFTMEEAEELCSRLGAEIGKEAKGGGVSREPVVHGLRAGYPLCDFTRDTPRDWPQGHVWVRYDDPEKMNCQLCIRQAIKVKAAESNSG